MKIGLHIENRVWVALIVLWSVVIEFFPFFWGMGGRGWRSFGSYVYKSVADAIGMAEAKGHRKLIPLGFRLRLLEEVNCSRIQWVGVTSSDFVVELRQWTLIS